MRRPIVSVLCPVFDGEATLEQAVASIRRQSFVDWELILLDDGSSDGSAELSRRLAASDPRIRFDQHEENRGLGAAMTTLAGLARGDYLAVQEQDDVSAPERLQSEVAVLDQRPEIGLVSGVARWVDEHGEQLALFPELLAGGGAYPIGHAAMVCYLMIEQCKVVNAGCMFRRQLLDHDDVFFDPDARMSVDWQFFIRLAHHAGILGLTDVVVDMRRGGGHASLTRRKQLQFAEARRCLGIMLETYGCDVSSPIDYRLYRRAMATELVLEGRHWGRWRGVACHLQALARDPSRLAIWRSLANLIGRGGRHALGRRPSR